MKTRTNRYLLVGILLLLCLFAFNYKAHAADIRVLSVNGGDADDENSFLYSASMFFDCIDDYYVNGIKVKNSNCKYRKDPSYAMLDKAIDSAFTGAKSNDISIFFYSGHGTVSSENGHAGLYTCDGRNYEFSHLYNKLKVIKGKKLVILDCCYSGSFITQNNIDKEKFTVMTACKHNSYSPFFNKLTVLKLFNKKQVVMTHFTDNLLKGLGYYNGKLDADVDNNKIVSIDELYKYLQKKYQKTYTATYNGISIRFEAVPQLFGHAKFDFSKSVNVNTAKIELNKNNATLYEKASLHLKATIVGKNKKVTWKSSNTSVVSVSSSGKVMAKKAGKAIITASANGKKATCVVVVKKPTIKLNKTKVTMYTTDKNGVKLNATITGVSKKITWNSSNKKIATVNSSGKVTAKKAGKVTITAKANGVIAKCILNIRKKSTIYEEYYKLISKKNKYGMYDMYACMDINNDKIPELFVWDTPYGDIGVGYKVYTYKNDKLVYLGAIYGGGEICMLRDYSGVTCSCADLFAVYKWENGKLVRTERYTYSGFDQKLSNARKKYDHLMKIIPKSFPTKSKAEHQNYLRSNLNMK